MTKYEIVETLAKERAVEKMVENISHQSLHDDLYDLAQMVYVVLLDYDDDKIVDLWENGQINFFLARVILNQFRSNTSPFYTLFRKFADKADTLIGKDWIDE